MFDTYMINEHILDSRWNEESIDFLNLLKYKNKFKIKNGQNIMWNIVDTNKIQKSKISEQKFCIEKYLSRSFVILVLTWNFWLYHC